MDSPPVTSGSPATSALVRTAYAFQPAASDPDSKRLSFRVANKPSWAAFSTATGRLSGTPNAAGSYPSITISVSDGKATTSLAPYTLTVVTLEAPTSNTPPTISGIAVTSAEADRPYAFQPSASDADKDVLSFSIASKPAWATFDSTTGTLFGTPTSVQVGTYPNIVISVSDDKASTALPAYSIVVAPAATKSLTLRWAAPTTNVDGTALTNLAGYVVSYGTTSGQYGNALRLQGSNTNSVVIEGLASGTYYLNVKSVNDAGVESDFAGEVVASVDGVFSRKGVRRASLPTRRHAPYHLPTRAGSKYRYCARRDSRSIRRCIFRTRPLDFTPPCSCSLRRVPRCWCRPHRGRPQTMCQ